MFLNFFFYLTLTAQWLTNKKKQIKIKWLVHRNTLRLKSKFQSDQFSNQKLTDDAEYFATDRLLFHALCVSLDYDVLKKIWAKTKELDAHSKNNIFEYSTGSFFCVAVDIHIKWTGIN